MLTWIIDELTQRSRRGRKSLVNNFKVEGWVDGYIFIRELFQNILDNRLDPNQPAPARVSISFEKIQTEKGYTQYSSLVEPIDKHLQASEANYAGIDENPTMLVIKEEGTTGFKGDYTDSDAVDSDWANFFYGEALEAKSGSKNGRAGQGKIIYYMLSQLRCVFLVTKRAEDGKLLLMGNINLSKTHKCSGKSYETFGFWANNLTDQPMPCEDEIYITEFCSNFGVDISTLESGNVYFIPQPSKELTTTTVLQASVHDFYFPILRNRLSVEIDGNIVNKDNLISISKSSAKKFIDKSNYAPSPEFLEYVERCISIESYLPQAGTRWGGDENSFNSIFDEITIKEIKKKFNQEKIVAVQIPIFVSKKDGGQFTENLYVYLKRSEGIEQTEEAFIRTDLFIAKERRLRSYTARNAFGLVIADERSPNLAEFLANAEEASHLEWSAKESKVEDNYVNIKKTLTKVRQSLQRLFNFLLDDDESENRAFLIGLLSIPSEKEVSKKRKKNKKSGGEGGENPAPPELIPSNTPVVYLSDINQGNGFNIFPTEYIHKQKVPFEMEVTVAFDNVLSEGDPMKLYTHLDFDFSRLKKFEVTSNHCEIISADLNKLFLKINNEEFDFSLKGFNENVPLKVKYKILKEKEMEIEL
jgi:hypothetical protein